MSPIYYDHFTIFPNNNQGLAAHPERICFPPPYIGTSFFGAFPQSLKKCFLFVSAEKAGFWPVMYTAYAETHVIMICQPTANIPGFLSSETRSKIECSSPREESVYYGIVKEQYILSSSSRTAYGLAAYADVAEDLTATIVASVHDITADFHEITKLAFICNQLNLPESLLQDFVEDYLDR